MQIGYFGYTDKNYRTKVHIVLPKLKLLCGNKISKNAVYQWCSMGISLYSLSYLECKKCKKEYQKLVLNA